MARLRGERDPWDSGLEPEVEGERAWILALLVAGLATTMSAVPTAHVRRAENESAATRSLRQIVTAQSIYREGGKSPSGELRYGSLEDLAHAGLIDAELGSGTKAGYFFEVQPSVTTSEFLWFGRANPILPGETGDRSFATNQAGVTFYRMARDPIPMDRERCELPGAWATGDHQLVPG